MLVVRTSRLRKDKPCRNAVQGYIVRFVKAGFHLWGFEQEFEITKITFNRLGIRRLSKFRINTFEKKN